MADKSSYIFKGILLLVCGILFGFFPGVLSWVFYIIGGIIIIGSALTSLSGLTSGDGGALMPAGIVGGLIGMLVIYIPKFINAKMSVIAGLILAIIAVTQIVKALKMDAANKLRFFQLIFGILLLVGSIFLMFRHSDDNTIIRFGVGAVMLTFAAFNFYVAYVIDQRYNGKSSSYKDPETPDIIDVDSFTEKPDATIETKNE